MGGHSGRSSRVATPLGSPEAGRRRPGWGSGAALPDTRPTPRHAVGAVAGGAKQVRRRSSCDGLCCKLTSGASRRLKMTLADECRAGSLHLLLLCKSRGFATLPFFRPLCAVTQKLDVQLSHAPQPLRSRYSTRSAKPGPRSKDAGSSWGSGEFLDSATAANADMVMLGDLPVGSAAAEEDEAGPLDDLLSQVTDLLSQMHELCQDEDE